MKKVSVSRMIFLMGLYSIAANFVHPVEPAMYASHNFPDYIFGVAMAAMSLTNFLFAPFWGKLLNSYGCANITGVSFIGYAAAQYMFCNADTVLSLTIARLLAGFFISTISASQLIYIMGCSDDGNAARNLMINSTVNSVLSPVGYLVGGVLGDISIELVANLQVISLAVIGVLFFLILDDPKGERGMELRGVFKDINPLRAFGEIGPYMNAMLAVFLSIGVATSFAAICYEHSFNYLIQDEYGFLPSYTGYLKAAVGIVALVSNTTLCAYLLKKAQYRRSTVWVLGVLAAMSIGIVVIKPLVPFIAINVVFFGFNAVYAPLLQGTLTEISKDADKGVYVGAYNAIRSVGSVAGSLVAGFAYEVNSRLPFVVTASLFTLATVLSVINLRQAKAKAEA